MANKVGFAQVDPWPAHLSLEVVMNLQLLGWIMMTGMELSSTKHTKDFLCNINYCTLQVNGQKFFR